jgi:hypothetical protein
MSRNKVLTIIIIAIVALLLAFGIWYYFSLSNGGFGGVGENGGLGGVSFPSGTVATSSAPATINGSSTAASAALAPVPTLREIANVPVAGAGFEDRVFEVSIISTSTIKTRTGTTTATTTKKINIDRTFISYMQRADGHVYETATDTLFTGRLSNTTIPKIYHADFATNNSILLRYLDSDNETVESFLATLYKKPTATSTASSTASATSTATTTLIVSAASTSTVASTSPEFIANEIDSDEIQGNFLPTEMYSYALSPDMSKIFYLLDNSPTGSIGDEGTLGSTNTNIVFSSPFRQWVPDWASDSTIFMTTSASANSSGYLYQLNQSTGGLTKLLGPKTGFSTLGNADGSKVLYSTASANNTGVSLFVYSLKDQSSTPLNLSTLPDKCVWSKLNTDIVYCAVPNSLPEAEYPDAWYQGTVSFTDSLWSIDTATGQTLLLANPTNIAHANIDGMDLQLDSDEDTLMFMNKNDLTLWDLRLIQPTSTTAF